MKKIFAVVAGFLLFLLLDVLGGVFYHPFHLETQLAPVRFVTRSFAWDGILLMLITWLVLLLISLARKRFVAWAPQITVALVLAVLTGYFLKIGFVTHNW